MIAEASRDDQRQQADRNRDSHEGRQAAAVEHLTQAVKHWESYAKIAGSLYRPQLLARTRRVDFVTLLEDVRKDVDIARRRQ